MDRREFTLDRFTRCILTAITVLLTIIAIELWAGRPSMVPTACAQIPDSGMQRNTLIDEARQTNQLLGEILKHLRSKPIKVKMEAPDKPGGGRAKRGKP